MALIVDLLRARWSQPVFLVALAAALVAVVVQSGDLGSSDAAHRLQAAHSMWTSEPPVFPSEYPEFGVRGRGGKIQTFYGIGQSLLFLPADVVGGLLERLPVFAGYSGNDPAVRTIVVGYAVSVFLNVATALLCLRFLAMFGFSRIQAVAGTLALLLATTHLHYTQVLQENNYIFLLTLAGLAFQFQWVRTGSRPALIAGSAAFGLNLLTRITTGLDLLAAALFILLVLLFEGLHGRLLWARVRQYAVTAAPVYLLFGILDRVYQFYRFGSFGTTYMRLTAIEMRQRDPSLPASFPFSGAFHSGFLGALFSPEKSIFLFDPLMVLTVLLALVAWRRFTPPVKAYFLAMAAMLLAYVCFYARYFAWAGDWAWGDRYVSTAVEFMVLLSVPLLLRHRRELGRGILVASATIGAISVAVQAASLAFWLSLEQYQLMVMQRPVWVVPLRFENIAGFALGKMHAWGLYRFLPIDDAWDAQHITCWNFLPFQLQHASVAPEWVVRLTFGLWFTAIAALALTLMRLWQVLRRPASRSLSF